MDPISALRMMATPEMQRALTGAQAGAPGPIPPSELQKLGAAQKLEPSVAPTEGASFERVLGSLVQEVSEKQAVSRDTVNAVLSGENISLHQAMIAMEEASVSFQLMVEVRNKLLESYQELMRMQV